MDSTNKTDKPDYSEEEIERKLDTILKQTNYTHEEAKGYLLESNMDEISVIKKYLGISEKKNSSSICSKSVQQEIYKQIRHKLNETKIDITKVLNEGSNQGPNQG
jgi:PAB1-binding protein PBP1